MLSAVSGAGLQTLQLAGSPHQNGIQHKFSSFQRDVLSYRTVWKQKTLVGVSATTKTYDPHKITLLPSIGRVALSYAQFTWYRIPCHNRTDLWQTSQYTAWQCLYSTTPFIRINWDGETSGYAKNPDNWIFFNENRLHWQYEFRPLLFTVCTRLYTILEAITLYCNWFDNR